MSESEQTFHVGDGSSNLPGDAKVYDVSENALTPISPQKAAAPAFKAERRALSEARKRCHSPLNKDYRHYGARGIAVCGQWRVPGLGFDAFIAHIGPKPTAKHTLDRVDNTRGYEPGNVRWVTMTEQANNRRSSKLVTFEGETHTAAEWGRLVGVRRQYVANAVNKGQPLERLLKPLSKCQPKGTP